MRARPRCSCVAALYVDPRGVYSNLPGVDPWDERRDARRYSGPWAVVAHPPCQRFGRYWPGQPGSSAPRKKLGDDGGCFASALEAVRTWGGVLEHPAISRAWGLFGLRHPPIRGGWVPAGDGIGWTCHVEQGHYGHFAPKPTWLYAVSRSASGSTLPQLIWGPSGATGRIESVWSSDPRRWATPPDFAAMLLDIARRAQG